MSRKAGSRHVIIIGYPVLLEPASCKATDYRDATLAGVPDYFANIAQQNTPMDIS